MRARQYRADHTSYSGSLAISGVRHETGISISPEEVEMTDSTNGGMFRYPVDRKFVDAMDRVLAKYHPEAEADFEEKKKAGEDTSKHVIHDVMKVLSEMASAEREFEAYRTAERQVRDILAAHEWRTSDDKVEWYVRHSRHQLVNHVFSALSNVESLLGGSEHEIPADVRRFLTLHVNAKET
jgi:hypothetical protein